MTTFKRQRGASLLTMLLLVAMVSIMVLAGIQALTEGSRSSAVGAAQAEAEDIAHTGIQEGMGYFSNPGTALVEGQYGTLTDRTFSSQYSLYPMRRGFVKNTDCQTLSFAESLGNNASFIDKNCPYYDLVIRNRTAYNNSGELATYELSSRDVPNGVEVSIPVRGLAVLLTLQADQNIAAAAYKLCESASSCTLGSGIVSPGGAFLVGNFSARYFRLNVTYNTYPATPITVLKASGGLGQVVLGKGYITVEATGYSGEVVRRFFLTIRGDGKRYLSETPFTTNQYGALQP